MYYFLYALLYVFSLLPFFILYIISDFFYFLIYRVFKYRRKVVFNNLEIAFPEKTLEEKKLIGKNFYRNLIDNFIESIKLLSISDKEFRRRAIMDFTEINALVAKGKNIQLHGGHQMNWEYGHWAVAMQMPVPWLGVYMRINSEAVDRLFYKIRSKGSTVLVAVQEFRSRVHKSFKQQYAMGLIADQNPGQPASGYWLNFFNRPVPFATGPDKGARKNNTAVVFIKFVKLRRGYYRYESQVITENAAEMSAGALTLMYRDFLERAIRENPDNYLWSHRRWKWDYKEEFKKRWIDVTPAPVIFDKSDSSK
ncbi:MAG: lipid A biosynthesis acyltransferase [Gloeobacteraceae cyanobacterium ES-bin-316]|nr:lipid A biosynthesis acyltransferase [Ferruginibacter sp.]